MKKRQFVARRRVPLGDSLTTRTFLRYFQYLPKYKNPVGIIPLDDSNFSACKSPIKYFHYAVSGIAVIASDVSPYKEVIVNGLTGLLVRNSTEDWFRAIQLVVNDHEFRRVISDRAEKHVRAHHHVGYTVEAWSQVISKLSPVSPAVERRRQEVRLKEISRSGPVWPRIRNRLRSINQRRKEFWRRLRVGGGL